MRRFNLLLAIRQLQKNKGFTLLNILGLTLGLTTFVCITLYVVDELRYDRFNLNADRIYRVNSDMNLNDHVSYMADAAPPVAANLEAHYPEVQTAVRLLPQGGSRFQSGNETIREDRVVVADPDIFEVFTLPMIDGDPATALKAPNTVVITASTAKKYFGSTQVLGRTLADIDDSITFTVTGIIRDMPAQSSFHYDIFRTSRGSWIESKNNLYSLFPMSTFILLKPGASVTALSDKLRNFMATWDPHYDKKEGGFYLHLNLTPLTDIHLRSNRTDELETNGSIQYVYIFSAIAIFVLLLAAVNFMNLSTAQSTRRAREVGVRKMLGSARPDLIGQFLSESFLTTLIAAMLALGLTALLLPLFNGLAEKSLALDGRTMVWLLPFLLLLTVVLGFLAGAWPAFYLSAFRPVDVLKNQPAKGIRGSAIRNTLVVFQFAVSLFLIIGTLIVYRQLRFIQNKNLGFDRSKVLVISNVSYLADPLTFKKEALRLPGIGNATLSSFLPTNDRRWHNFGMLQGSLGSTIETQLWPVDADYIPTLEMEMVKGRNLSAQFGTDSTAMIINETAAQAYGIANDPLNRNIAFPFYGQTTVFHVIGVVKDFNFASLRDNVTPLAMVINRKEAPDDLIVRVRSTSFPTTIAQLKTKWAALSPGQSFAWSFMDADFDAIYRAEQRMGQISILFSTLAILIACLGLFGLSAFAAERRRREISIRKVFGASVASILSLLSFDFLRLIAIAILIAMPLAWLGLSSWLDNFAYRTDISAWVFVLGAVLVLLIALATTLFQSLKAAVSNPVDSLRTE
jgi:putative ABC transport system permease protein